MYRNFLKPVSLAASLVCVVSVTAEPITLKDSVLQVIAQNPSVYSAIQEYKSRGYEVREAKSGYLPSIDLGLGVGYEATNNPSTRTAGEDEVELTRKEASLNLRQLLFDGFAASNEVRRQKYREQTSKYEAFSIAENQALRTSEVYLEILKSEEFLLMAKETLAVHEKIFKQMRERNKAGIGSEADLTQVSARLALADGNVVTAQANHDDAISNYIRVVGSHPVVELMQRPNSLSNYFDTLNIKSETEVALRQHPTLLAATSDVTAAQAQYSAASSTMWPRVHLEASKRIDDDIGGVEGRDESLFVGVRLRYDIYVGGRNSARKGYTSYQVENAKGVRDNAHLQVIEAMRLSFNAYNSLKGKMAYQKQHVDFAKQTRDAYKEQFNLGKRTLLDVLNTENEYVDAKRSLVRSSYDRQFSEYRIMNAKGELLHSIGLSVDDLLALK